MNVSRAILLVFLLVPLFGLSTRAQAQSPHVVTDIAPVHSLVSQVLGDLGTAEVLIKGSDSPHEFSLRPSLAKALTKADIVFMMGRELTPWLDGPLDKLAGDAQIIALLESEGVVRLPARNDAHFAGHQHGDHSDPDNHQKDRNEDHEDSDVGGHEEARHATDPHAWLDPTNALLWLDVIAAALSEIDQQNASVYQQNAANAKSILGDTIENVTTQLASLSNKPFLVYHDSFQYFEHHFGLRAKGAIAGSDASRPGPARVEKVRRLVNAEGINCVLGEPQFNAKLVSSVAPKATLVTVDVLGATLEPGAQLFNQLLTQVGASLEICLR